MFFRVFEEIFVTNPEVSRGFAPWTPISMLKIGSTRALPLTRGSSQWCWIAVIGGGTTYRKKPLLIECRIFNIRPFKNDRLTIKI